MNLERKTAAKMMKTCWFGTVQLPGSGELGARVITLGRWGGGVANRKMGSFGKWTKKI